MDPDPSVPAAPFLKWAGGKRKLLPQLKPLFPADYKERLYCEPFLGGGSVFFSIAKDLRGAVLSDANASLIRTYQVVQTLPPQFLACLKGLSVQTTEEEFYRNRDRFNKLRPGPSIASISHAALFIYLNKTCFNGLWRVNRGGQFNVPWGHYKAPLIDDGMYQARRDALGGASLRKRDFREVFVDATPAPSPFPRPFIYLDPPYDPISETSNFTGYTADKFTWDDQLALYKKILEWDKMGCKIMLSQADTPRVRELFDDPKGPDFFITELDVTRSIAAKANARTVVTELVIRNYA